MKIKLVASILLLLLFACGKSEQENNSPIVGDGGAAPSLGDDTNADDDSQSDLPTISKLKWYKTTWKASWSSSLKRDLEQSNIETFSILPGDLKKLGCIGYNSASALEKQKFWIVFFASIAANESAFNPKLRYYEQSLKEYSEGLLQLSLSDKSSSPFCRGINRKSILTGEDNLRCGLGIMQRQLRGSSRRSMPPGTLFPKRPYYWSVLTRPTSQIKVIDFFKTHLTQLTFCR